MRFATDRPVKIVMLGAGGTGAHIAPNLYRLLYSLDRPARVIVADGDSVEQKNLVRQHFSPAELGMNKARAVAERYAAAFKMEAEYIPDFIEDAVRLTDLVTPSLFKRSGQNNPIAETVVLIGAVDNNKSRRLCHEVFMGSRDLIYIDSGNGEFSGQVVCGVRRGGRTMLPPVGVLYPDVLEETDKFPSELSCAEASVSAPQAITANLMAAAIVVTMIFNILVLGEIQAGHVSFSTKSLRVISVR
jgi:hypothetical protein